MSNVFAGLEMRETVNGVEVQPRRESDDKSFRSLLHRGFLNLNFDHQEEDPVQSKVINFILPLSGRYEIFQRFLQNYEDICLTSDEKTSLLIVLYQQKSENTFNKTIDLIEQLKYKYRSANIEVLPISGDFSRARALDLGASRMQADDLMLFIDVDIVFTSSALNRIRLNTLSGRRIYFPIVFSQYDPKVVYGDARKQDKFSINEISGHWRQYGFGIVSLYKRDYRAVGGLDLSIQGWGKEDVEFFEKAVKSDLDVFRAADRHLVHVYHEIECSRELSSLQFSMCMGSKTDTYAGVETLADMIYRNPNILRFAKERRQRRTNPAG